MINTLQQRLAQLINPCRAQQLAKQHGWCKRSGTISAFEFLFSGLGQASALDLTLNAQASTFSEPVSRQAVDQRYNPAAVEYFKAVFLESLATTLAWKNDSDMTRLLQQRFRAVRLFDSTHCSCSDALAKIFPGCGGGGRQAGLKVLLSYDYTIGQLHSLELLPAKCSDQGLAPRAAQQVGKGELGLFDKGFYQAQAFGQLIQRGGFFVVPWHHGVSVSQIDEPGQVLGLMDVAACLKASTEARLEWSAVQLGKTDSSRLGPVRLLAYRLAPENAGRRRAQLREKCRTHGRTPTQSALELAGWLILLTNAPTELLPIAAASYLYRVRWQIELVFKQWKSVLRLDVLSSSNGSRVQCQVWARLLNALLAFVWYQHANAACLELYQREISFIKVAKQLQQQGQVVVRALFVGRERIRAEFKSIWKTMLKLARKEHQPSRPTTWENLCFYWLHVPVL